MKPLKQLFTWTLGLGTLFFSASAFATLRITEICPRPDALDPNGKEGGWIELTNLGDKPVNLKDYALIRWNRGKENKEKNRRKLCERELGPGERTLVYTSEAYPNYWDGEKVTVYNDVMVFPSKVNPKKFPNVALYSKDQTTLLQTLIIPVDLEDNKSFGLRDSDSDYYLTVFNQSNTYDYQVGEGEKSEISGRLVVTEEKIIEGEVTTESLTTKEGGLGIYTDSVIAKNHLSANKDGETYTFGIAEYASNQACVENKNYISHNLCSKGETLSFWMKPSAFDAKGQEAVVLMDSRDGSQGKEGYLLLIGTNDDGYNRKIYVQRAGGDNYSFGTQSQLTLNDWVHVAFSIDANSKEAYLYINGLRVNAEPVVIKSYLPSKVQCRFGGTHDSYWRGFRGNMAKINIFPGVLSKDDVMKLYNASAADVGKEKVTEGGLYGAVSVEQLETVKGTVTVPLTAKVDGAQLTLRAKNLQGTLTVFCEGKPVTLGQAMTLDGETESVTFDWTLEAADLKTIAVEFEAEWYRKIAFETLVIMPNMTPGKANDYTNAIAYGPNIGPSNKTTDGGLGYTLEASMATMGKPYTITLDVHPIVADEQNAITKVELMYRSNFGDVKYVAASGSDGKYTGEIPAEDIPANGQLIQFGARITDGAGRQWISPSRNNPDDCPLWYGTIVTPTLEQKSQHENLQTFHLFVENRYLPGGSGPSMDQDYDDVAEAYPLGARVGIYDAQTNTYYDNVRIDLRGNTSADFPKKSHGLRFSKCQPLTCKNVLEGTKLKEIRKTSFTAEYADPTFIRQSLSFHVWRNAGNKVPFHYPVRLNLNGEFYQLAFHSNRFTDELIEDYYGLDPMGYGYKNVGMIAPKVDTTAGSVEKKTPDDGDETSEKAYEPLADWAKTFSQSEGCPENDATLNGVVYYSFDIPAWINYLATARITQECDDIWANICLYWDKNGNDVWMPLAYDHNLSFGAWYYGDDSALGRIGLRPADDTFKSHPFYGGWKIRARAGGKYDGAIVGPGGNYAVEALWQNPEIRQMYLRRLRTLMDEHLKEPGTEQKDTPFWKDYVNLFKEVTLKDAELDRKKWGYPDLTQSGKGKGEEIYVWDHANWDDSEIEGWDNNLAFDDMWDKYVVPRRTHLYETHSITNTEWETGYAADKNAGIPTAHPEAFAPILMEKVVGGVQLTNPNTDSIDLSGWTVEGLMDVSTLPEDSEDVVTLPPGTVLLGGKSLVLAYDRKTYVANNDPCFVIGLAVYGDDKTWIPEPNTEATSIVLKKANGVTAVDNVLPEGIADWLYGAIEAGTVTAADLAEVTAAADYEFACLVNEAPIADMEAKTELDISNIMIDENGDVILTATLFVNNKGKNGELNGVVKLYSKATLADDWTEDNIEFNTFSDGAVTLPPVGTGILRSATKPCFFQIKLTK